MSVLLATADHDLGLVPTRDATSAAQEAANAMRTNVTLRDPTTDALIATVKPAKPRARRATASASN